MEQKFENNLKTLQKCVNEKDLFIETLQNEHIKRSSNGSRKIKCSMCDFEGNSNHGLKIHMARKHTETEERNLNRCELCEKVFETVKEMKKHLQTHSYKKANFKCVDCEFVGTNEETMEVHIGKTHADIFECGLYVMKQKPLKT